MRPASAYTASHLLEYGSKSPRRPAAYLHIIELPKRHEAETNRVLHGLHLERTGDLAGHDGVYQGAKRRRDADAVDTGEDGRRLLHVPPQYRHRRGR
jgi:hypothetical protein